MVRSVADSWALIVGWLEEEVPTALEAVQGPAPSSAVSAVRMDVGRRLPSDLLAWLNLTNGFKHRGAFGSLLPTMHTPLPCEQMLSRRALLRGIYATYARPGEQDPAGSRSGEWLDSFLPISDTGTDLDLFIDLRDGDLYGCIGQFDAEAGGFEVPRRLDPGQACASGLCREGIHPLVAGLRPPSSRGGRPADVVLCEVVGRDDVGGTGY